MRRAKAISLLYIFVFKSEGTRDLKVRQKSLDPAY